MAVRGTIMPISTFPTNKKVSFKEITILESMEMI
jgi:hypothetical protein